ncbi:hypothetical protein Trydic_g15361 [Trypoxylus dichotomus]
MFLVKRKYYVIAVTVGIRVASSHKILIASVVTTVGLVLQNSIRYQAYNVLYEKPCTYKYITSHTNVSKQANEQATNLPTHPPEVTSGRASLGRPFHSIRAINGERVVDLPAAVQQPPLPKSLQPTHL